MIFNTPKTGLVAVALAVASLATGGEALSKPRNAEPSRDCQPYNAPSGFYGNIWCEDRHARPNYQATSDTSQRRKTKRLKY